MMAAMMATLNEYIYECEQALCTLTTLCFGAMDTATTASLGMTGSEAESARFALERAEAAVQAGYVFSVLGTLRYHDAYAQVSQALSIPFLIQCYRSMSTICVTQDSHSQATGVFKLLAQTMPKVAAYKEAGDALAAEACSLITNLLGSHPRHELHPLVCQYAVDAGMVEAVIGAMSAHLCRDVQEFGARALINLCKGWNDTSPPKQRALQAGVFNSLLQGMRAHPRDAAVQEWATNAILVMCAESRTMERAALVAGIDARFLR
jgi:hypothetical protein